MPVRRKSNRIISLFYSCVPITFFDRVLFALSVGRTKFKARQRMAMARHPVSQHPTTAVRVKFRPVNTILFTILLRKSVVIHLTTFYKQLTEDPNFKQMGCIGTYSHYTALYLYKQKKYDRVLKLCERIFTEEETMKRNKIKRPKYPYKN